MLQDACSIGAFQFYLETGSFADQIVGRIERTVENVAVAFSVSTRATSPTCGTPNSNDEHTIKAGLNYRFGWGNAAASRY